eukprot:scaffold168826_cov19-Prasinocladus_malaysianus.AAC.1
MLAALLDLALHTCPRCGSLRPGPAWYEYEFSYCQRADSGGILAGTTILRSGRPAGKSQLFQTCSSCDL